MPRRKAVWGPKRTLTALAIAVLAFGSNAAAAGSHRGLGIRAGAPNSNARSYRLDDELSRRAALGVASHTTRVIVELQPGASLPLLFKPYARRNGGLNIINGQVLDLPNGLLRLLAAHPSTVHLHYDRPSTKANFRTSLTAGYRGVQRGLGYTGAGVGVAVIDSGIAAWHDDLTSGSAAAYPYGNQRVSAFVDFVSGQSTPYDDDGHGTHVAGIIAGNGYDSNGTKAGVAPDASLVVLKVLDANGNGTISSVIQALDWVLAHRAEHNIRVVNLSIGAAIRESYWTDPLTLAAKRLVDAGIVVVSAAGNLGFDNLGQLQYGGVGAPGNAPWVLTVGASSTNGTVWRGDDSMAGFSSRGPTYLDWAAKPDLVAPGVGTVSLAAPGSTFYETKPWLLSAGSIQTAALPYLSLSGTSVAAPVVTGTVALMLQANPGLTPNAVKAILQYTAQEYAGYDALTQGAGFLNTVGAVRLARFYATAQAGQHVPVQSMWSRHIIWGNQLLSGGLPDPSANAFALGTDWGVGRTVRGENIVWGTTFDAFDNIVWGTGFGNIVWGTAFDELGNIVWGTGAGNIVWGTDCGGADCDDVIWGTLDANNIVWGTAFGNIVWGTAGLNAGNIVWGTDLDLNNIVWGTEAGDNIVWGTAGFNNIVWGTDFDLGNIVWGTADGLDNIVWGTSADGPVLWDATINTPITWDTLHMVMGRLSDEQIFGVLSALVSPPTMPSEPPVAEPPTPEAPNPVPVMPVLEPVAPAEPVPAPIVPLVPDPTPLLATPVAPPPPSLPTGGL